MKIIYKQAAWVAGSVLLSINTMDYIAFGHVFSL